MGMRIVKMVVYLGLTLLIYSTTVSADEEISVHTVALFKDKAMLSINGGRAKILKVGESYKGVKLLSASTKEGEIELNGLVELLELNSAIKLSSSLGSKPASSEGETVQLWSDKNGFFRAAGSINGERVNFLVDTGANLVVLSSAQANRIGLEYKKGQRGMASTASGTAPMYVLSAREISFESIKLGSIEVGVIEGSFPRTPLLGMSFLERLDMNRSGNMMTLKKRF